jgi:hypothetical protein
MSHRDLGRLLVKIAALIIIVSALTNLPTSLARLLVQNSNRGLLELIGMTFAPPSISLLAGFVMYLWAGPIVDRTLFDVSLGTSIASEEFRALEEIAVTLLGFFVLIDGLGEGAYYLGRWFLYNDIAGARSAERLGIGPTELGGIMASVTRIVLGVLLVLLSRGVVTFRRKLLVLRPMHSDL